MPFETSNNELLCAWKSGDQDAAKQLFDRYQYRLLALVRSRLSKKLARRVDAEDILLSAYRSFFIGVQRGRCASTDTDDLWPLLTTIVLRKLARQARYHKAECRSIDEERQDESSLLESLISDEPTAEHAAILTDEIEQLLSQLDVTAREVFVRTLQGEDAISIANTLEIHERTVRRAIERIRHLVPSTTTDSSMSINLPPKSHRKLPVLSKPKATSQGTTKYGNYLLKQFVGMGAFSKVYRAIERSNGEVVAIKYLRKECWHDPRAAESLIREYEILQRLNHPRILKVRGWGTTPGGSFFLVADFIEGGNLATWRSTGQPKISQILKVMKDVTAALTAAHSEKVIHGDLKPANVLMDGAGQITLCDFGLSRYANDPDDVPRGGTAGFLAPEQISNAFGSVTELTDVYGLGGLLYALLTGGPPMSGRDMPEIMANVLSQKLPEPPLNAGDSFSSQLNALILMCLQKEPRRRFSSVKDFSSELSNLVDQ